MLRTSVTSNRLIAIHKKFEDLKAKPHHPALDLEAIAYCEAFITETSRYGTTSHLAEQAKKLLAEFRGWECGNHQDSFLMDFDLDMLEMIDRLA